MGRATTAGAPVSSSLFRRVKADPIPILFFGGLVALKLYFLFDFLWIEGYLDHLMHLMEMRQTIPRVELTQTIANGFIRISYNIFAIIFDLLVLTTYMIRSEPVARAEGFWERYFPLITVLLPTVGFTILLIPQVHQQLPLFDLRSMALRFERPLLFVLSVEVVGLAIAVLGTILSILSLWTLKKSFSLMAEVRQLVTTGMYRTIRHPLYMSEITLILGVAILSVSPVGIGLFLIATAMQVVRAKLEERKFLVVLPAYAEYKQRTGFLWPKLS